MNKLNRANVDSARRLRHQQQLRIDAIFASDDQLLLIAAGECARGKHGVWRSHVERLDDLVGAALNRAVVEKDVTRECGDGWTIMHSENRVFREREVEQQSAPVAIFRNMRDSPFATNA